MVAFSLLLFLVCQGSPSGGDVYHPGSERRPYGRMAEPSSAALIAVLEDRSLDASLRLDALEFLAYRSEPVSFRALQSIRHLVRGEAQINYARCLGLSGAEGLKTLRSLQHHRRPEVRAEVTYALVLEETDGEDLGRAVLQDRKKKPIVRVAALRALADRGSSFANVEALRRMSMEQGILLYECLAILRREPSEDYIPALIELLGVCTGRAANEAVELLQTITRYRIANDYKTWKHFFLKHKADGTPFRRDPDTDASPATLSYMGVPIYSDRVVFVLDSSASMNTPLAEQPKETRASKSVKEFVRMLPRLPKTASLNVIFFDSEIESFHESMVPLSSKVLAAATDFVQSNRFDGGTNLFAGMEQALMDPETEEILLLSDGAPSVGEIVDPLLILARVARWNRWRGARVSTISFGAPPQARAFLYRLAMGNRGFYRVID